MTDLNIDSNNVNKNCLCTKSNKINTRNDPNYRDSLIITVKLDGNECNLLVDTGSVINVLAMTFAQKAKMDNKEIIHQQRLVGLTDSEDQFQETFGIMCEMELPNLKLDSVIFNVSPEIHKIFEYAYGGTVDGIIGHETLEKINAIIDYKENCIYYSK